MIINLERNFMITNDKGGYVTIPMTDLVILSGIDKNNKPYRAIKIDSNRSFRYADDPKMVEILKEHGVKEFTIAHNVDVVPQAA